MNDPNRYRRSFRHRYDHLKSAVEAESACWRSPLRGAEASTADFRVERETSALGHRRRWRAAGVSLVLLTVFGVLGRAADSDPLLNPAHRLAPAAPAWSDLIDAFAHNPDIAADFTERRFFSFKKEPVDLKGEVRVSVARGLSLHYTAPEERTVILDAHGVLIRAAAGDNGPPADPRAAAANDALLHILRFDFGVLEKDFELYGQRNGAAWTIALVPRTESQRRTIGRITVSGETATVRQIELRRSARQRIEISIDPPRPAAVFTAEELKRFFR